MNETLQVFSVIALLALGAKLLSLVKYVTSKDWNGVVTQLGAFGIGLLLAAVAGESAGFENIELNGTRFGAMNGADLVLVGLALGGAMSWGYDLILKRGSNPEPPLIK